MTTYCAENPFIGKMVLEHHDPEILRRLCLQIEMELPKGEDEKECEAFADALESWPLIQRVNFYGALKHDGLYHKTFGDFQDDVCKLIHYFRHCGGYTVTK